MLVLILSWILLTAIFLSFGNILVSLWNKLSRRNDIYTIFDTFWLGLSAVSAIVCLLSLFSPLNIYALGVVLLASALYWIIKRSLLVSYYQEISAKFGSLPIWGKMTVLIIGFTIILYTLKSLSLYDFGLYHEQTMMWAEQYSVVPGLGNIHGRFAFNSNFLLLSTLFSYHPDYYLPFFPLNGLCFLIFFLWIFDKVVKDGNVLQKIFGIFIPFLFLFMFREILSSTSTDILPSILIFYLLGTYVMDRDSLEKRSLMFIVLVLSCITFKLSSAPIILLLLPLFVTLLKRKQWILLLLIFVIGGFIVLPWCIRFIILSGYLIYPYPAIDIFSFDWKIPIEHVIYEKDSIKAWAILPDPSLNKKDILSIPLMHWIPIWWSTLSIFYKIVYVLVFVSPIVMLSVANKVKRTPSVIYGFIVALIGAIISFFAAPDLRFAYGITLFAGFLPILLLMSYIKKFNLPVLLPLFMLFSLSGCLFYGCYNLKRSWYSEKNIATLIFAPQPINRNTLFDYIGNQIYEEFVPVKKDGFTLYIPVFGEQCYDFCLPCTTRGYMNEAIELRGETLQSGFRMKN